MTKGKAICSMILKTIIISLVFIGYTIAYLKDSRGLNTLLYFTIQSNLWLAIFDLVLLIAMIIAYKKGVYKVNNNYYRLQQIFTVCITVTGIVFVCILLPGILLHGDLTSYKPFSSYSIIFHMIVPTLGIVDYFMFTKEVEFKHYDYLYVAIPTLYYFTFALIGYHLNWDFGEGRNYPYFFLNYDSPAKIFGFSDTMPYFMGSFYWIILLTGLIIGLSYLYIKLLEKINRKYTTNF